MKPSERSTYVPAKWTRTPYGYQHGRIDLFRVERTDPVWGAYGPTWDVFVDGKLVCDGCPDLRSAKLRGLREIEGSTDR